ncbi:MFS family permease [Sporomusaceae bacterium BoRhaA]|uniref:MFS transporter n=1 Tax=Pelorhabdus rhamnosifermentans TaxID=2772457 RepID=UPI001FE4D238|nr:MFS transporter [Pelorhabdus rhamnosifermentans]MBU2699861.1 MFS family permease [Pelorhabdus rhamnosifermentans]
MLNKIKKELWSTGKNGGILMAQTKIITDEITTLQSTESKCWWREISKKQWYALWASVLGYILDSFDTMVYAFALTRILNEWGLTTVEAGLLSSVTLFSSAFGGVFFGAVADKVGRKKAIMITVLLFSIFSGLSGLSQNIVQLAIARALLGLGMGGEWTAGVLLISETWPAKHRGKAIGLMQSGWALGYFLAALAAMVILPAFGWRVLFFLGILPALFSLWVRSFVDETELWKNLKENPNKKTNILQIFKGDLLKHTVVITLASSFLMFAYWGLFSWLPGFLSMPIEKGGAGLSVVKSSAWMMPTMLGAWGGYVSFGFLADKFGRRPIFAAFLMMSSVFVYVYGNVRDANLLILLGPFVGFFGSGAFSGFGAFTSELYPTSVRGLGAGFTYNVGRIMSAFAPIIIGYFAGIYGLGVSLGLTAVSYFLAALTIYFIPETKGVKLK